MKHAVITGASSGIGAQLARSLSDAGYRLTLVARRLHLLEEVAQQCRTPAQCFEADLADLDRGGDWAAAAVAEFGDVDLLVNNAGIQYVEAALAVDDQRSASLFSINLIAPIQLIARLAPGMCERGRGAIVNIVSVAALAPTPSMAHYSAAKAGLGAYSEVLRGELHRHGVKVVTVYPGPVATPLATRALEQLKRSAIVDKLLAVGTTEALAKMIIRALEQDKGRVIYPRLYKAAWAMRGPSQWISQRFSPSLADD